MNRFSDKKRRIYIELTNRCNFKCSFCPYSVLGNQRPDMDIALVKRILKEISQNIDYRMVYFHNIGEPLLYGCIDQIFSYCDTLGIRYGLTTNGALLTMHKDAITASNLTQLNISYQSTVESLHCDRCTGLTLKEYRREIIASIEEIMFGGFKGEIRIKLLTTRNDSFFNGKKFSNINNSEQLSEEIDKFYFALNGNKMNSKQMDSISSIDIDKHIKIRLTPKIFIETFPFLNWGNYGQKVFPAFFGRCGALKEQLLIISDGSVLPCCYDLQSQLVMGNINNSSLTDILSGEIAKKFKDNCSSIYNKHVRCRQCQGKRRISSWVQTQFTSFFCTNDDYQDKILDL